MTARVFLESVDPWINWDWLSTHIPLVLGALGEHVELTAIALATGLVISVPLGVAAHRSGGLRLAVLGFFGAFYTIPSLALFALLIPFTHLSGTTAEIPLIGYNVLILVRNVLVGLDAVPRDVLAPSHGPAEPRLPIVARPNPFAGWRWDTPTPRRAHPPVRRVDPRRRGDRAPGRHRARALRQVRRVGDQHLQRRSRGAVVRHPRDRL